MSLTVTYAGHATVLLENEKRIVIDPWLEGNPSCPESLHTIPNVDLICLTHGHQDHTGSVVELAKSTGATVCATFELATLIAQDGVPENQIQFMNKGGSVVVDGVTITLTNAFHSSSYVTQKGDTVYAGEACGVVVQFEDGTSIYHAGDTCLFRDMKLIRKNLCPSIAFLPIGDRFTMGPKDAVRAVQYIKPQVVIPVHWGTFDLLSGTPEEFGKEIEEEKLQKSKLVVLQPGETYSHERA